MIRTVVYLKKENLICFILFINICYIHQALTMLHLSVICGIFGLYLKSVFEI